MPENTVVVETGTYLGQSAAILAEQFVKVITFERDSKLAARAKLKFASNSRIQVVEGSTRDTFASNIPDRSTPCLFWLDAHYSGGITAGADDPCPLLYELSIIFSTRDLSNTILIIDDVREMIGGASDWPTLVEVCALLHENGFNGIFFDDTLVVADSPHLKSLLDIREHSRAVLLSRVSQHWKTFIVLANFINYFSLRGKKISKLFRKA